MRPDSTTLTIVDNTPKPNFVTLSQIPVGGFFRWSGYVYRKLPTTPFDGSNLAGRVVVMSMRSGEITYFTAPGEVVQPLKATLTVEAS